MTYLSNGVDINFILKFVTNDYPVSPQTGDYLSFIILTILLFAVAGVLLLFISRRIKLSNTSYYQADCSKKTPSKLINIFAIFAFVICVFFGIIASYNYVYADINGNETVDNQVLVYVDDENQTVSFSSATIKNVYKEEISVSNTNVTLTDAYKQDPDLKNSNIEINTLGSTIYNSKPDNEVRYIEDPDVRTLKVGESCEVEFSWNISFEQAINMLDTNPLNITMRMRDSNIVTPQPGPFMYKNKTIVALSDADQYTVAGQNEGIYPGNYTATITPRPGFKLENPLEEYMEITWSITPYILDSDDTKEAYIKFTEIGPQRFPYMSFYCGETFDVTPVIVNNIDESNLTPVWNLSGKSSTEVKNAGNYVVTITDLNGEGANNFKLVSDSISQNYEIFKASNPISPPEEEDQYFTSIDYGQECSLDMIAAKDYFGTVTYTKGEDFPNQGFDLIEDGNKVYCDGTVDVLWDFSKTTILPYNLDIVATASGDENHDEKTIRYTLKWIINPAKTYLTIESPQTVDDITYNHDGQTISFRPAESSNDEPGSPAIKYQEAGPWWEGKSIDDPISNKITFSSVAKPLYSEFGVALPINLTVSVNQEGDDNHLAADTVFTTVKVKMFKADPVLSLPNPQTITTEVNPDYGVEIEINGVTQASESFSTGSISQSVSDLPEGWTVSSEATENPIKILVPREQRGETTIQSIKVSASISSDDYYLSANSSSTQQGDIQVKLNKMVPVIAMESVYLIECKSDSEFGANFAIPKPSKTLPSSDVDHPWDEGGLKAALKYSFVSLPDGFTYDEETKSVTISKDVSLGTHYLQMMVTFIGDDYCESANSFSYIIVDIFDEDIPKTDEVLIPTEIDALWLHDSEYKYDACIWDRSEPGDAYVKLPLNKELYYTVEESTWTTHHGWTLMVNPNQGSSGYDPIIADCRNGDAQSDHFIIPNSVDYSKPDLGDHLRPFTKLKFIGIEGDYSGNAAFWTVYKPNGMPEQMQPFTENDYYFPSGVTFTMDTVHKNTYILNEDDLHRVLPGAENGDSFGVRVLDTTVPVNVSYKWEQYSFTVNELMPGQDFQIVEFRDYEHSILLPPGVKALVDGKEVTRALPGVNVVFTTSIESYTKFVVLDNDGSLNWKCVHWPSSEIRTGVGVFANDSGRNSIIMPSNTISIKAGSDGINIDLRKGNNITEYEYTHSGIYDGSPGGDVIHNISNFKFGMKLVDIEATYEQNTVRLAFEYPSGEKEFVYEGYQFLYVPYMFFKNPEWNRQAYCLKFVSLNTSGYVFSSNDAYIDYSTR